MKKHLIGPETPRLLHRAWEPHDAEALFLLNGNPEVMRWTGEPMLNSIQDARDAIANYADFETVGFGRWACILKESQSVIGFCGLKYLPDLDEVDVGYRFMPEYWGRGLATEACRASLEFGFNRLGLEQIIALVLPQNVASIRVLEKSGMKADGRLIDDDLEVIRFVTTSAVRQSS